MQRSKKKKIKISSIDNTKKLVSAVLKFFRKISIFVYHKKPQNFPIRIRNFVSREGTGDGTSKETNNKGDFCLIGESFS